MGEPFDDRPVTVLFTDVEGSTDLRSRLGDDEAHAVLSHHAELVRVAVAEHGGREIKSLGDGFMIAFASPRRALACAQAVERAVTEDSQKSPDRAVRVRIGITTGEVVEEGGDLFGQTVHAAARIAAKARGGEILVAEVTRALTGSVPELSFSDRGRFRLKGFEDRWRLFELAWAEEHPAPPMALGEHTPFVGRESERAALSARLDQVLGERSGGMVLIGGEPGIGKTRLTEEAAGEARQRGMAVLTGHSYEMEGASPYVAFIEVLETALSDSPSLAEFLEVLGDAAPEVARLLPRLRRIIPDLPPPLQLPPEQERRYLFTCLTGVIERMADRRTLLLVLDDLQWADEPTLAFVEHLAPQLARMPVLVMATYRDVEVGRPLARTFADLHRRHLAQRLSLDRLSEADTAQVLRALAGQDPPPALVRGLYTETEGNPFFLEEVFRYLVEQNLLFDAIGCFRTDVRMNELDVPEGVRLVIGRRLDRLSAEAQRLLTTAAVAGRVFSFRLLQALDDFGPDDVLDAIDEAERAVLVVAGSGDDEFLFAHELIRQTLVARLSRPRRHRIHRRAADAMTALWAQSLDEHAAEIAHHLAEAGDEADPKQLFSFLVLAGRRALDSSAFEEALIHFERALTLEAIAEAAQLAELLFALGATHRRLGHWDDALAAWRRSLAESEAIGDAEAIGRACLEVGFNLAWAAHFAEGVAMYQQGLAVLGDRVSPDRARLLARLGMTLSYGGDPVAGDTMFAEAVRIVDDLDDEALRGFVLGEMCCGVQASMRVADVVSSGRRGAEAMRATGDLWGAATALGFVEISLVHLGRFSESAKLGEDLAPLAERIGNHSALYLHGRARGMREFFSTGDLAALEAFARWDMEFAERMGWLWIGHAFSWLGFAHFLRGDWEAAGEWLERGSASAPPGLAGFSWGAWFQYLAYSGRREEAVAFFEEKRSQLPTSGQLNTWTAWALLMAFTEGLFVLGHRDLPAAWYPLVREAEATGATTTSYIEGRLLERVAGIAATAAGDWDAAERHFLLAARHAEELPHRVEALETRRFHAQMLAERARQGDGDRARELLGEAAAGYARLGMPRHRELAGRALDEVRD